MNLGALLGFTLLAGSFAAQAWGPEGHEIVGRIAELHLTPTAAKAVEELLGGPHQLAPVANWADNVRSRRRETAPWHYVNIPFAAENFDADRDCTKHEGCVVEAISNFIKVVADGSVEKKAREEALKFVVHFVGDIHQPLHCGERNGDKGGNLCIVRWPGFSSPAKLHVVWDVHLPRKNLEGSPAVAYADKLRARITPQQVAHWSAGTSENWAWESHQIAVTKVYSEIPESGPPHLLSDEYVKAGQGIVDEQLSKAGVRLAFLLNGALGK